MLGCFVQVSVHGEYGRLEKKEFMGVAKISLKYLKVGSPVIGWYKLYNHTSLEGGTSAAALSTSSSLTQMTSQSPLLTNNSKEKLKNQNSESSVESAYQSGSAETKS